MSRTFRILSVTAVFAALLVLTGCGGPNLVERVGGSWGYGICGTLVIILDIIALIEIVGTGWSFGRKALWALLIIFFPVGGLLFYWFFAREDKR